MTNILTIDELKNSVLNANVDDEYIQPAIDEAQSIYLREILGDALLNAVINKINGNNLTGKYLTLVNEYIKPYLSYMVQSIIVVPITYKIRNAGVIQQYDNGFTSTQMKDTQYLKDYYDGKAEFYGNRLTEYLKKNASDIVEYRLSASNVTNPTTSQNVTNIFLGGTKRGKCGGMIPSGGGTHDTVDWDDITNRPNFAVVATSGSYNDLINKPTIPSLEGYATEQWVENQGYSTFSGDYEDLANKPELFSGDYNDLSNKPEIPTVNNATLTIKQGGTTKGTFTANANENVEINLESGGGSGDTVDWDDIQNKPEFATVATSGSYSDLSNRPSLATVATSGDYRDLEAKPDLSIYAESDDLATVATSGNYNDLTNKPDLAQVATSGDYRDLNNKPNLAQVAESGDYRDLSNTPTIPTLVQANWTEADSSDPSFIRNKPSLGAVATSNDYRDLDYKPSLAQVATSGDYRDLSHTPSLGAVATSNDYRDLDYRPTIITPVQADWDETDSSQLSFIKDKPTFAQVATSGDYRDLSNTPNFAAVATSGDYHDLIHTPTIVTPVNANWNETDPSELSFIQGKPSLAQVATSGDYSDLSNTPSLGAVATSNDYDDLDNKPTIPTVNDGSLTIQKNGTTIATFTANDDTNKTANITVPTDETDLGLTTETWTFTLQDSSTVTKQVVIKPTV